jgi:hypothetical protein
LMQAASDDESVDVETAKALYRSHQGSPASLTSPADQWG